MTEKRTCEDRPSGTLLQQALGQLWRGHTITKLTAGPPGQTARATLTRENAEQVERTAATFTSLLQDLLSVRAPDITRQGIAVPVGSTARWWTQVALLLDDTRRRWPQIGLQLSHPAHSSFAQASCYVTWGGRGWSASESLPVALEMCTENVSGYDFDHGRQPDRTAAR